jgi:hypothetical protein
MTNYTSKTSMVRVDFFKESGKWYSTEEMNWLLYKGDIIEIFLMSLSVAFQERFTGMYAVCLEPYHENAHPIMVRHEGIFHKERGVKRDD